MTSINKTETEYLKIIYFENDIISLTKVNIENNPEDFKPHLKDLLEYMRAIKCFINKSDIIVKFEKYDEVKYKDYKNKHFKTIYTFDKTAVRPLKKVKLLVNDLTQTHKKAEYKSSINFYGWDMSVISQNNLNGITIAIYIFNLSIDTEKNKFQLRLNEIVPKSRKPKDHPNYTPYLHDLNITFKQRVFNLFRKPKEFKPLFAYKEIVNTTGYTFKVLDVNKQICKVFKRDKSIEIYEGLSNEEVLKLPKIDGVFYLVKLQQKLEFIDVRKDFISGLNLVGDVVGINQYVRFVELWDEIYMFRQNTINFKDRN